MKKVLIFVVLGMLVAGCRTAPVLNIDNAPIETASGNQPSLSEIGNDIKRAGIGLGWQMKEVKPGHIVGTLYLRSHMAKVDITYNTKEYSIAYKDSSELDYDGQKIHKNYNGWIQNLNNAIRTQAYNDQ